MTTVSAANSTTRFLVIGGGIVGLSTALHLAPRGKVVVLEAETKVAQHQTGHNSGVIHAGLYYKPGSARARNCAVGREAMFDFCAKHGVPHQRTGKIVVAVSQREVAPLEELHRRGLANGLSGIRRLNASELRDYEPHVAGIAGLHVPETGIADYGAVARKMAELIVQQGGEIVTGARVDKVERRSDGLVVRWPGGELPCQFLVNCGGLQCDRVARLCGLEPGVMIVPFRGEYYALKPEARRLVNGLIYPVPDPRLPFLGVHFTRTVHGDIEAGPNAVLAFRREGYRRTQVSLGDMAELLGYPGFWKMAAKYWRTGAGELWRSFNKRAFHAALRRLLPAVGYDDLIPFGAGVRAQALDTNGNLVDDFRFVQAERMVHVLNAPSPAATASLSVGRTIAELVEA